MKAFNCINYANENYLHYKYECNKLANAVFK